MPLLSLLHARRFLSRIVIASAIFVVVFFLTSCGGAAPASQNQTSATSGTPSDGTTSASTQLVSQAATPEPSPIPILIAARVNGQVILLADLDREVLRRLDAIKAVGDALPSDMDAFRLTVLDGLIQQVLIEQAAAAQGITVSDAEVDAEIKQTIDVAGGLEKWRAQLAADKMTEVEFRGGLRSALITQKIRDIVTKDACLHVEQVRARHILVADEPTALQVKAQLDRGADFAQLASQYSLDVTTRQSGGDLGWFTHGQLLQRSVEDTAFALALNAISGPVKSELGYHIIQTTDRSTDRPVDDQTCALLSQATFERWIRDLVSKATIEKFPNGQPG